VYLTGAKPAQIYVKSIPGLLQRLQIQALVILVPSVLALYSIDQTGGRQSDIRYKEMKLGIGYFQRMETQAKTVLIRSCLIFLRKSA
jgi:hypothetical protein